MEFSIGDFYIYPYTQSICLTIGRVDGLATESQISEPIIKKLSPADAILVGTALIEAARAQHTLLTSTPAAPAPLSKAMIALAAARAKSKGAAAHTGAEQQDANDA